MGLKSWEVLNKGKSLFGRRLLFEKYQLRKFAKCLTKI
jgi:hypothetical protein